MIIRGVCIKNIKKFSGDTRFDFTESKNINTISGKNGAGKSTIFECVMLGGHRDGSLVTFERE